MTDEPTCPVHRAPYQDGRCMWCEIRDRAQSLQTPKKEWALSEKDRKFLRSIGVNPEDNT